MTRFILAFSCFFRLLFGAKLHPKAAKYLPEDALRKALPPKQGRDEPEKEAKKKPAEEAEKKKKKEKEPKPEPPRERKGPSAAEQHRDGALAFLALLQREGRLVDFLRESIEEYDDSDIGAAVRDIHRGCKKVIDEHLELEAVMPGEEEDEVSVPKGFDPGEVRLIGEVSGEPPFKGVLRHHGWRATKVKLPTLSEGVDRHVVAPAEVEIE